MSPQKVIKTEYTRIAYATCFLSRRRTFEDTNLKPCIFLLVIFRLL